ncbi:MAG: hypothetical protein ACREKL_01685 [Chthoniobacterales bacterium]
MLPPADSTGYEMSAFYLLLNDAERGPFTADDVAVMVRGGVVGGDAGIRAEGDEDWYLVSEAKFEDIAEEPPRRNRIAMYAGAALGLVVAVVLLLALTGAFRGDQGHRQNVIEDAVRIRLNSPASATFIWRKKSDEMWTGFVDSQNGSGALKRSIVTVTNPNGTPSVSIAEP